MIVTFTKYGAKVIKSRPLIYNKKKVFINPPILPETPPIFWKLVDGQIKEMDRKEKIRALKEDHNKTPWSVFLYYQKEIVFLILLVGVIYRLARH